MRVLAAVQRSLRVKAVTDEPVREIQYVDTVFSKACVDCFERCIEAGYGDRDSKLGTNPIRVDDALWRYWYQQEFDPGVIELVFDGHDRRYGIIPHTGTRKRGSADMLQLGRREIPSVEADDRTRTALGGRVRQFGACGGKLLSEVWVDRWTATGGSENYDEDGECLADCLARLTPQMLRGYHLFSFDDTFLLTIRGHWLKSCITCRFAVCLWVITWSTACEETSRVLPMAPSPLPTEKVGQLTVICPLNVQTQSLNGQPVPVTFPPPVVSGGLAPIESGCAFESGATFAIGTTAVVCNTSDSIGQTASCTWSAVVLAPPRLTVTKFLAFGDSLTAGVVSPPIRSLSRLEPANSYPFKSQIRLAQRYQTQFIDFVNAGLPGEDAALALGRFQDQLALHKPKAVFIMEGANDLGDSETGAGRGKAVALTMIEAMVVATKASGADPFVMTIPPQRAKLATVDMVAPYNNKLRALAIRQNAGLIDVFGIISTGQCPSSASTLPCLGDDHLHPTAQGYELIADAVVDTIIDRYDVTITPSVDDLVGSVLLRRVAEGDRRLVQPWVR